MLQTLLIVETTLMKDRLFFLCDLSGLFEVVENNWKIPVSFYVTT